MVGSAFGGIFGTVAAIKMRSFWVIPVSMFGSAGTYGCIMGFA